MFLEIAKAATAGLAGAGSEVQSGLANKVAGFFDYMIGRVPSWIAVISQSNFAFAWRSKSWSV